MMLLRAINVNLIIPNLSYLSVCAKMKQTMRSIQRDNFFGLKSNQKNWQNGGARLFNNIGF